jgi:GxxExxY protein
MEELLFKDEVYRIVGSAIEVHKILGPGFLESVYQEALSIEFGLQKLPFVEKPKLEVYYKDHLLESYYIPDFICYDEIVVEIKAITQCGNIEEAQIFNELKSSKKRVGILINFGELSLFWKRFIYTKK